MSSGGQTNGKGQGTKSEEPAFNCTLCGNLYTEPRIIPCGHIFCAPCLNKHFEAARQDGAAGEEGSADGGNEKQQEDNLDQVNSCACPTQACSESIELVTGDASQFPKSFILEVLTLGDSLDRMDLIKLSGYRIDPMCYIGDVSFHEMP